MTLNNFKYDKVKSQLGLCVQNGSLVLDEINSNTYYILCFDLFGQNICSSHTTDKNTALELIEYYKTNDMVHKIYVEKPTVGAIVFINKEGYWIKK